MSSELERRLEGMLAEAPEPEPGVEEEALHRALRSLQPSAPARRGLRTGVLVFAAALVLLAIAAGSLAAAGALHVSFGAKAKHGPATTRQLSLPRGANGIAAIVDGRLSVVTRGGFRLQGLPASAVALSPHALYAAAGIGTSLVALKPDGHQAWSHRAGGNVVAIAWAPDGLRIAYVVRRGRSLVLHVIWGNGTHDATIDRSARAVRPSWRSDSLAFAYVGAGGKAIVYDLAHRRHSVVGATGPVTRLAFEPVGRMLLTATPGAAFLDGKKVATGEIQAVGWFHGRAAAALESGVTPARVKTFGRSGHAVEDFRVPGRVVGLTGDLVVTRTPDRVLAGWNGRSVTILLDVRKATSVEDLAIG